MKPTQYKEDERQMRFQYGNGSEEHLIHTVMGLEAVTKQHFLVVVGMMILQLLLKIIIIIIKIK